MSAPPTHHCGGHPPAVRPQMFYNLPYHASPADQARQQGYGRTQYYFHDLTRHIKGYLRSEKAVPVALVPPYGATPSSFMALATDAKLAPEGNVVPGNVGHDRIQQAAAGESIGEAIRYWYKLKSGDFERIN